LSLNKEETLSVTGKKTCFNNPEVDLPSHTKGLTANVYVLSITGSPLMPCTPAKARKLLKSGRATVVKLYPFTIKLTFECENQVQEVSLGIDTGYENIGYSCVSEKRELASGTLILDDKTNSRLVERAMYRRGRRKRHHWYRKQRFLNRKKPEGWLSPSIQRRYNTHLHLIDRLKTIVPISKITIEVAKFDIQKIENPEISGIEYKQGNLYGYQNIRSYLLAREHGLCQLCKKKFFNGDSAHIHHCKQRNEEGSDRAKNLAILHDKCHKKLHKQGLKLPAPKSYRIPTFLSIINKRFRADIQNVNITYGNITFVNRQKLGLEKTHYNDAFVIAGGTVQERAFPVTIRQKHRNNRAIQLNRKGYAPSIRRQRYTIQPKDLIWIGNKKFSAIGIQGRGREVVIQINPKKSRAIKKVDKMYNFGSFAYS